jgi:hypothetical protein
VARTAESQKISITLVSSMAILAAVLVTGTVVNLVSSAAHGSVNVQPKTNQHPVTKTLQSRLYYSQCTYKVWAPAGPGGLPPGHYQFSDIDCDVNIRKIT